MEKEEYKGIFAESKTQEEALSRLVKILSILRKECPWDKAQTHESLRICMIEEAYEACDAIDHMDMDNLEEELGDVFLQVLFHSALAEETAKFSLLTVINRECEKMIRRHPHVFLKENIKSVDKAVEKWENVKRKEKGQTSYKARLEGVPLALPALIRSHKIQARAAEIGFDWDDVSEAFQKVKEETEELLGVYQENCKQRIAEEIGDLLFSVVNVARFLKINPEQALNDTSEKFIRRFAFIEDSAIAQGKTLEGMTLEEMDKLWDKAKQMEGISTNVESVDS